MCERGRTFRWLRSFVQDGECLERLVQEGRDHPDPLVRQVVSAACRDQFGVSAAVDHAECADRKGQQDEDRHPDTGHATATASLTAASPQLINTRLPRIRLCTVEQFVKISHRRTPFPLTTRRLSSPTQPLGFVSSPFPPRSATPRLSLGPTGLHRNATPQPPEVPN